MKQPLSLEELHYKAAAYCSLAEHCSSEVETKLTAWGATPEATAAIMAKLIAERYIDEERYCRAYVREKWRFQRWGKGKISQGLWQKGLPQGTVAEALEEIDPEEYLSQLTKLLRAKQRSTTARDHRELHAKLCRFGVGRGFELSAVLKSLKLLSVDEPEEGTE